MPLPGKGSTGERFASLAAVGAVDVTLGRLFEAHADDLSFKERQKIEQLLRREIEELFHGRNLM